MSQVTIMIELLVSYQLHVRVINLIKGFWGSYQCMAPLWNPMPPHLLWAAVDHHHPSLVCDETVHHPFFFSSQIC